MSEARIVPFTYSDMTLVSDVPEVADGQGYWAFLDDSNASQLEDFQSQIASTIDKNPDTSLVFPNAGGEEMIWSHLVPQLAILSASPQKTAIIVVPVEKLKSEAKPTLWKFLVDQSQSLKVTEPIGKSDNPSHFNFPELAPNGESIPKWLRKRCEEISFENVQSPPDAIAVKAGLFQIHGDLHTSHEYAQDCQGEGKHVAGDYWHAIMHRREPDYGNSKYWFRRVGNHPIFANLVKHTNSVMEECSSSQANDWQQRLTSEGWNPNAFVDLCEECANGRDQELTLAAKKIQWIEMILLLQQTYFDAVE